ncbi:hypothetical protein F4860DRAFT_463600 [Xylaria cubensis]|nr:hypothetical protein F4860DRAFT_463600 [Xylaria cubensis]
MTSSLLISPSMALLSPTAADLSSSTCLLLGKRRRRRHVKRNKLSSSLQEFLKELKVLEDDESNPFRPPDPPKPGTGS